jgi:ferredoxin
MSYKIIIDRSACSGFGTCIESAPQLFAMGDDGVATAVAETDDRGAALEAAQGCPMGAITVLDGDGNVLR